MEKLLKSELLFTGKFLKVVCDHVVLPDNSLAAREYINHNGAVAIIALTADNKIVVERQYRNSVKQVMLEIPAGKLEPNEKTLEAAQRELLEETGYSSTEWIKLGHCFPCIGYSSEKIDYYLAKNITLGKANLDVGEFLETFTIDFNQFVTMAYNGEITDSKTLSGIMLYQGYLQKTSIP